ncbi:MAG: hypothetical protein CMH82_06760, partial [Nocardioides sp.]|nr:hypothetical protein [Nocardioides sp.]
QPAATPYETTEVAEQDETDVLGADPFEADPLEGAWPDERAHGTRVLPWDDEQGWPEAAPEPRTPLLERARRALLLAVLGGAVTAAVVAVPLLAVTSLMLVVWLLRSGSIAAGTVGARRQERGRRWWDGPRLLLGAPWDLVRSIPSTLVLQLWSLGLALAAGLLCYAVALDVPSTLAVTGAVLVGSLWWGPGGSRVRSPVGRVVRPLSATLGVWAVSLALVAVAGAGAAYLALDGVDWTPLEGRPLSGVTVPALQR